MNYKYNLNKLLIFKIIIYYYINNENNKFMDN